MNIAITDFNNYGILRHSDEINAISQWNKNLKEFKFNDTGLCNRLFFLEFIHFINSKNDYNFNVIVDKNQWLESKYLDISNTNFVDYENINFSDYIKIDEILLNKIINEDFKLDETKNYCTDFKYRTLYDEIDTKESFFIQNVSIKENISGYDLKSSIKDNSKDLIGIHLRRGRGVNYTDEDIKSLPESIRDEFLETKLVDDDARKFYIFDFIQDKVYFDVIDLILEKNPNQKFYVSTDMDLKFISHWVERYKDKIHTKMNFFLPDALENIHYENVVDLFALSNTKMLIKFPVSSWSTFASLYKEKNSFLITDDIEKITYQK